MTKSETESTDLGSPAIYSRICEFLRASGVNFREVCHEPTLTSEDSAKARGEELRIGGKALLIKVDDTFRLFVMSADRKLDSGRVKQIFGAKKTRFATREELAERTGLVPGSVPPFGDPVLPFPLYVDRSILENEKIAFNAGLLTQSIILSVEDYTRVAQPTVEDFSMK